MGSGKGTSRRVNIISNGSVVYYDEWPRESIQKIVDVLDVDQWVEIRMERLNNKYGTDDGRDLINSHNHDLMKYYLGVDRFPNTEAELEYVLTETMRDLFKDQAIWIDGENDQYGKVDKRGDIVFMENFWRRFDPALIEIKAKTIINEITDDIDDSAPRRADFSVI